MTSTMAGSQSLNRRILALATIGALTACGQSGGGPGGMVQPGQIVGGGTKQIAGVQPVGGFLPNPSLLNPGGAGRADLVYRSPTANFASYNKGDARPGGDLGAADRQLNAVPVEPRQAAANAFYSDLHNALSRRCPIVTAPSPGTMRMRFALVDAKIPIPRLIPLPLTRPTPAPRTAWHRSPSTMASDTSRAPRRPNAMRRMRRTAACSGKP